MGSVGVFLLDGAALGRQVWLLPDEELPEEYLGSYVDLPPGPGGPTGATPAIRIERTLRTVCTRTRESLPLLEEGQKIRRFSARMIAICEREAGWFYKFTGDGGIFVWTDWSGDGGPASERRAAAAAMRAAQQMQRISLSEFGGDLRIGLPAGEVTWSGLEEGFSFEGTGKGIDIAARMEKAADDGEVCASQDLVSLLDDRDGLRGPRPLTIQRGGEVETWFVEAIGLPQD